MAAVIIMSFNVVRAEMFGYKPTLTQKLIKFRSKPHVHSEVKFSGRHEYISFSATLQDDFKGARFKDIAYSHQKERWDPVIVPMTDEEEDDAYLRAQVLEGKPYDLIGQLSHVSKHKIWKPNPKKTWCSKAVAECIYSGRPDFGLFIERLGLRAELRPDELDMLARYYFIGDYKEPKPLLEK